MEPLMLDKRKAERLVAFIRYTKAHAELIRLLAEDGEADATEALAGLLDSMMFARRSLAGKEKGGREYERAFKIGLALLRGEALARLLGVSEDVVVSYGRGE